MRALAAITVVVDHIVGHYFVPYHDAHKGLVASAIYPIHYMAGSAVMFFFVLSGYLVGTSVLKSHAEGRWSWSSYLLSRCTRLYMVLIPALLLTALVDGLGRWNRVTAPTYAIPDQNGGLLAPHDTLHAFLSTLLFVQNIHGEIFGSDGAAWSLAYEFWFYILFPILALAVLSAPRKTVYAILYLGLFLGVAWFSGFAVLSLFPTWLLGVLAGFLANRYTLRNILLRRTAFTLCALGMALVVVLLAAHKLHGLAASYATALFAMGLIWSALNAPNPSGLYARISVFFSEMSYTLYLTHEPVIILLFAFWVRRRYWPADPGHAFLILVPMGVAFVAAYLMYRAFEAHTDELRRYLRNRFVRS
jgi:peptidoglycan/LPS O-acetylase OafA/YrhL